MYKEYECPVCHKLFPYKKDHFNEKGYPCDPVAVEKCRKELEELRRRPG